MRALAPLLAAILASCAATAAPAAPPSPSGAVPAATAAASASPEALVTPVPAPAATPSPAPVALPRCGAVTLSFGDLARLCPRGAVVLLDALISDADAGVILSQVADDLAAVEREFGTGLRAAALIDVYATRDRYAAGLRAIFGYAGPTAEFVADNSVAFFEPALRRIAVNWEAVRERRPVAAIRHELTHLATLQACAPRCDLVPAWLNEGQARLAEALIPGAGWRLLRVRYEAASMAATGTLIPVGTLVTQASWNALTDWAGYYKYQQAARMTELLREDIGDDAIARLYARIRAGDDVARAYERLAGRPFEAYLAELPARILAAVPERRGIVTIAPGADGTGVAALAYGLPPGTTLSLRHPARVGEVEDLLVSPQGASFISLDAAYRPGAYTLTAAGDGLDLVTTIHKRGDGPPTR